MKDGRQDGPARPKGNAADRLRRVVIAGGLVLGLATSAGAATVEREGMRYDDSARVGNGKVVLNGVGVRGGFIKAYVAGLYLPRKAGDADAVYAEPGPKRISVRMLLDVDGSLLARTFGDGIRKNYKDDALDALADRMAVFDAQVKAVGGVKKGDAVDLDYEPSSGTRLRVNGKAQGEPIAGDDFYVALLKMFIGERAVDKNLRAALLGQAAAN